MEYADTANLTDEQWRAKLSKQEYEVLRLKGTEARGGEYDAFYPAPRSGHFACRGCAAPLYSAEAKFKSGCGWPAFDKCYKDAVATTTDSSHGMVRIEITCAACGGHLGHVFQGEKFTATNERHAQPWRIDPSHPHPHPCAPAPPRARWSPGAQALRELGLRALREGCGAGDERGARRDGVTCFVDGAWRAAQRRGTSRRARSTGV